MRNPVHLLTYEQAVKASEYLHNLANGALPEDNRLGICANLHCYLGDGARAYNFVVACSPTWEEYAGSPDYPVEGDPKEYYENWNKWEGEYAAKRRDLCKYLAERIDKTLEGGSW